jgi:hypothetical protein
MLQSRPTPCLARYILQQSDIPKLAQRCLPRRLRSFAPLRTVRDRHPQMIVDLLLQLASTASETENREPTHISRPSILARMIEPIASTIRSHLLRSEANCCFPFVVMR